MQWSSLLSTACRLPLVKLLGRFLPLALLVDPEKRKNSGGRDVNSLPLLRLRNLCTRYKLLASFAICCFAFEYVLPFYLLSQFGLMQHLMRVCPRLIFHSKIEK